MLAADGLRGDDSTGAFTVEHNGNVHIAKEASNAYTFLGRSETATLFNEILMRGAFAVGHNRAATRGAIVDRNAHPFWVNDEIVLVQNGTWNGDHKHVKNTEVDTEAVAHIIAGETDIKEALKKINAAYALVWYNVNKKELYMIRNKERPLWFAMTADDGAVFASEAEIILFGASRAGLKLKEKPYLIDDDNLITVKLDGGSWELDNNKVSTKYTGTTHHPTSSTTSVIPTMANIGQAIKGMFTPSVVDSRRGSGRHEIHNYIHRAVFVDWHVKDINLAKKYQSEYATRKDRVYMEMIDYIAADNKTKDCKNWHLVFSEISATKDDPGPLFYHTMKDVDEKTLVEMIDQPFRIGSDTGSPVVHILKDTSGKEEYICAVRINSFKEEEEGDIEHATAQAGKVYH